MDVTIIKIKDLLKDEFNMFGYMAKIVRAFKEGYHENEVRLTRDEENKLYTQIVNELENGERDDALWGRCISQVKDKDKFSIQAKYIELRLKELKKIYNKQ